MKINKNRRKSPLKISMVSLSDLKSSKRNARKHSKRQIEKLAASIREFGWTSPILATAEGEIIAGHGRLEAAKFLKFRRVPVIRIEHLSETQQRALRIADNQLPLLADWDEDKLECELADLKTLDLDFDLSVTGFDGLDVSFESASAIKSKDKSEDAPQDRVKTKPKQKAKQPSVKEDIRPTSRPGDLFILGAHRMVCGRALYDNDLCFQLMQGDKAQLGFSTLPIKARIEESSELGATKRLFFEGINGHLRKDEFTARLVEDLSRQYSHCELYAAQFLLAPAITLNEALEAFQYFYSIDEIRDYGKDLLFISGPKLKSIAQKEPGDSILIEMVVKDHEEAQWQLAKEVIFEASNKGDLVFDVYGSATLIACEETGRCARVIELSGAKVDAVIRLWQEMTGLEARLEQTGQTFAELREERMAQGYDETPYFDPVLMTDEEGDV